MNGWVVETPTFEEDLMNNRVVMLNQNGVNRVVGIIKDKDKEIERLNNIINEINSIVEYWGYDKEHNDISSFRMAMKNIKDVLGSDKEC